MNRDIGEKVKQKISEMEKAFSENPKAVEERENYVGKVEEFVKNDLPVKNYQRGILYKPFNI